MSCEGTPPIQETVSVRSGGLRSSNDLLRDLGLDHAPMLGHAVVLMEG